MEFDLGRTVEQAKVGDPEATSALYQQLTQRYQRIFGAKTRNLVDELAHDAAAEVILALPSFRILDGDDVGDQFNGWSYGVGRHILMNHFRSSQRRSIEIPIDEVALAVPEPERHTPIDDPNIEMKIKRGLSELLRPQELQVYVLAEGGQSIADIRRALGLTYQATEDLYHSVRDILQARLAKTGYQLLRDLHDKALDKAAERGRLGTIKILGRVYITSEAVARYNIQFPTRVEARAKKTKEPAKPDLAARISEQLDFDSPSLKIVFELKKAGNTPDEIAVLIRLSAFRTKHLIGQVHRIVERKLAEVDYKHVGDFKDQAMQRAASRGKLNAIRVLGRLYIPEQDAKNYQPTQGPRSKE